MSLESIQVAILIVSYNNRDDLADCLPTVLGSRDDGINTRVVLVDNASKDGTISYVHDKFPSIDIVASNKNRGFAGGNNFGFNYIVQFHSETQYVVLLNPDTIVESGWITPMVEYMQANMDAAIVQPKIRLHSTYNTSDHRINTAGNESHFLGFGFVTAFNELDDGSYDNVRPIDFASGAAQMTRVDLVRTYGLFDESMFMYLEDAEFSWKMRQLGYKVMYVPKSVVYHKYDPVKTLNFFYHLEKNRFWLLLSYYKIPTIMLISPAWVIMELGLFGYSAANKCLREKLNSYGFFLRWNNFRRLLQNRKIVQARRKVTDRIFVENYVAVIKFSILNSGVVRYLVNHIFGFYWKIVRSSLRW